MDHRLKRDDIGTNRYRALGFTPNWSVGLEYDHMFMGHRDVTLTANGALAPVGTFSRTNRIGQGVDLITARINYRFGGPVVAKY